MPVPLNQTAATAIDIGTLTGYTPYTTTQDAFDSVAGHMVPLWYSYLPVAGDSGLEIYGYGNGTTVLPSLTVRTGPPPANTTLSNSRSSLSRPVQQDIITYVTPGERVFFKFDPGAGVVNPAIITIRIARWQNELILDGDLFINDSSPDYPGIVMSPATAIPKRYSLVYPAGEGQQVLTNGIVGVIDAFTAKGVVLYDVASDGFTVRSTPVMPDIHYTRGLGSNQVDTFWAFKNFGGGNGFAVSISSAGVIGTPLDLGSNSTDEGTPQADNSALYVIDGNVPGIAKVTNPGGVNTPFLVISPEGANILMMTDDTLLVGVDNAGLLDIRQYNLSAVLVKTITTTVTSSLLERIFADKEDPNFFWIWWQTSVLNRFQKYRVSDGALVTDLSRNKFIESVSQTTVLIADTVYSGADFSCVPIVLRIRNVAKSGLYTVSGTGAGFNPLDPSAGTNPLIRHDQDWIDTSAGTSENVKIPDPYYDIYLVGDE